MFCNCILENKSIGICDGAFKNIELGTEKKIVRKQTN